MRYRTAFILAAIIIVGMFAFEISTKRAIMSWVEQGASLTDGQIFRIHLSNLWNRLWPFLSLFIVAGLWAIAFFTNPAAKKRA